MRENSNIDYGKEADRHTRTDKKHNQRRSTEKSRSCLDRRLDNMSPFLVHE